MARGVSEPIIRLDDCSVYQSMRSAAGDIGVSTGSVKRSIDAQRRCKGWSFAILPEQYRGFGVDQTKVMMWAAGELLRRSTKGIEEEQEEIEYYKREDEVY